MTVQTIPGPEGESPFEIGDLLTIYEAACVYRDAHPYPRLLGLDLNVPVDRATAEKFQGFRRDHGTGLAAKDVYFDLQRLVLGSEIKGAIPAYFGPGDLNPFRTTIPTSMLLSLARARGDAGKIIISLVAGAQPEPNPKKVGPRSARPKMVATFERLAREERLTTANAAYGEALREHCATEKVRGWSYQTFRRALGEFRCAQKSNSQI